MTDYSEGEDCIFGEHVERLARLNLGRSQQSTVTPSGPRVRHVAFAEDIKVGDSRTSTSSAPSFVSRPRSKSKDTSKLEDHDYALPSSPWPGSQISVAGDTEWVKPTKSGSQFVFKEWCVETDLANLVVQALVDNEFVSLGALVGMSKDDIEELKLPKKGLVRALETAVRDLQSAYGHGPLLPPPVLPRSTAEVIPGESHSIQSQTPSSFPLDDLLGPGRRGTSRQELTVGQGKGIPNQRMDMDPRVYLDKHRPGENSGAVKVLRIADFIPGGAKTEEIDLGGATIKLKEGRSRLKLDQISPSQWITANARIMGQLRSSGSLGPEEVTDYLAYTAKIGELASRYTWTSVVLYDNDYRECQAMYQFRWGSDSPHLATVHLRERNTPAGKLDSMSTGNVRVGNSRLVKKVCWQFNAGQCQYGAKCRFSHVCTACNRPHPFTEHNSSNVTSKSGEDKTTVGQKSKE